MEVRQNDDSVREKEWYREKILEMVRNINRVDILEYLCIFISGKIKEGKEDEE